MLLSRLENGSIVNLELVTEDSKYELISRVSGASKNALLVEILSSERQLASLKKSDYIHAVYNLYADDTDGKRIGWHNVDVRSINYKQHSYRGIFTKSFNQNSSLTDRRTSERIKLVNMFGQVRSNDGSLHEVTLYDISNTGIAFLCEDDEFLNKRIMVHLEDEINNKYYNLNVNCTCIRTGKADGKTLFGCSIAEADMAYLNYIFAKKLSFKKANIEVKDTPSEIENTEEIKKAVNC